MKLTNKEVAQLFRDITLIKSEVNKLVAERDKWKRLAQAYQNPALDGDNDTSTCDEFNAAWREINAAQKDLGLPETEFLSAP